MRTGRHAQGAADQLRRGLRPAAARPVAHAGRLRRRPDALDPHSAYAEGKRVAEYLAGVYHRQHGLPVKIARGFAFLGPYLPLDVHFAAGNFLRDGLRGGPVRVGGDGTPYRSYLYAADLAVWLWTLLFRAAPCRPYNVGAEEAVSIAELARCIAAHFGVGVQVARPAVPGRPAERYVPAARRAREELGLRIVDFLAGRRRPHGPLASGRRRTPRNRRGVKSGRPLAPRAAQQRRRSIMDNGHGSSANQRPPQEAHQRDDAVLQRGGQRPRPLRAGESGLRRTGGSIHLRTHFHRQRLQGRHRRRPQGDRRARTATSRSSSTPAISDTSARPTMRCCKPAATPSCRS